MIDENVDDIHKKSPAERESIVVSDDDAPVTPCKHVTRMVGSGSGPKKSPMTLREFFFFQMIVSAICKLDACIGVQYVRCVSAWADSQY